MENVEEIEEISVSLLFCIWIVIGVCRKNSSHNTVCDGGMCLLPRRFCQFLCQDHFLGDVIETFFVFVDLLNVEATEIMNNVVPAFFIIAIQWM